MVGLATLTLREGDRVSSCVCRDLTEKKRHAHLDAVGQDKVVGRLVDSERDLGRRGAVHDGVDPAIVLALALVLLAALLARTACCSARAVLPQSSDVARAEVVGRIGGRDVVGGGTLELDEEATAEPDRGLARQVAEREAAALEERDRGVADEEGRLLLLGGALLLDEVNQPLEEVFWWCCCHRVRRRGRGDRVVGAREGARRCSSSRGVDSGELPTVHWGKTTGASRFLAL